jgi:hypothetical protein
VGNSKEGGGYSNGGQWGGGFQAYPCLLCPLNISDSNNSQMTCQAVRENGPWTVDTRFRSLTATSPCEGRIQCCSCLYCCHRMMTRLSTRTYVAFAKQTRSSILIFKWQDCLKQFICIKCDSTTAEYNLKYRIKYILDYYSHYV